jgi:hypothetical protein
MLGTLWREVNATGGRYYGDGKSATRYHLAIVVGSECGCGAGAASAGVGGREVGAIGGPSLFLRNNSLNLLGPGCYRGPLQRLLCPFCTRTMRAFTQGNLGNMPDVIG